MIKKEKCIVCGDIAVYCYIPASDRYYCNKCVPRGCGCQLRHFTEFEPDGVENVDWRRADKSKHYEENSLTNLHDFWEHIDENGESLPCCEYDYEESGYYTDDYIDYLKQSVIKYKFNEIDLEKLSWDYDLIQEVEKKLKNYE